MMLMILLMPKGPVEAAGITAYDLSLKAITWTMPTSYLLWESTPKRPDGYCSYSLQSS